MGQRPPLNMPKSQQTPISATGVCCGKCFYLQKPIENGAMHTCRRFPPQMQWMAFEPRMITVSDWPAVMPNQWCGEFTPRERLS